VTNTSPLHYSTREVQDAAGNVYIFWDQNPGVYYMATTTGQIAANTWPTPVQYTRSGNNYDLEPAPVVLKNGTMIMFFSSKRGTGNYNIYFSRYNSGVWSAETQLTATGAADQNPTAVQDNIGRIWVAWARSEVGDINIRFSDTNGNGVWDPGETIAYDCNKIVDPNCTSPQSGNGVYDSGEPVIVGTPPAVGTVLKIDPRIGFFDSNGNNLWDQGEFVVYDPNLNNTYDPKLMYVDSNSNNVWDFGESIIYKGNSAIGNFTGTGRCIGNTPPAIDCVVVGPVPGLNVIPRIDTRIKFVDLNPDGVWEPGETLVYDTNNNGLYDTSEQAIAPLTLDTKVKFIGPGTSWAPGNTVVYDCCPKPSGNNFYDGKIKFVDTNGNGRWDPGETVVYDSNLDGYYTLTDLPIFEAIPCEKDPDHCDLLQPLKNDPGLKFVDVNGNQLWDQGEPVVYDFTSTVSGYNLNGKYDGLLKFVDANLNGVWDPGETVVYDTDTSGGVVGAYNTGRYHNDTLVSGLAPANNTALVVDPRIKFNDSNGNAVWDTTEPVVYDTNNNNLYDVAEPVIAGAGPPVSAGITTGLGETIVAYGSPSLLSSLKTDSLIKYLDYNNNGVWDPGEPVYRDLNGNNVYDQGEPIISGTAPTLRNDPKIKFSDTNGDNLWTVTEPVIYDFNGDNKYTAGRYYNDTLIAGVAPANNTIVKVDSKIRYLDSNFDSVWTAGESVVYDANNNSLYDNGESVILGPAPSLQSSSKIKYVDSNNNNVWDSAEAVVYDANNDGLFNVGEYVIRGTIPQAGTALSTSLGETWIAGSPAPVPGTLLKSDPKLKIVDLNGNQAWDPGEPVEYDTNNNGIFDIGDTIVQGNPVPAAGTPLKIDEIVLAGITVALGANSLTVGDSKIKYVETGTDGHWDLGETVIYDKNNNGKYDISKTVNDTIVSGYAPLNQTLLVSDPVLKFRNLNGGTPATWDIGEPVFYDTNNNNVYDAGVDSIVATFQTPPTGGTLNTDSKIKYFETGTDGHWDVGESVVYDNDNGGTFSAGDTVINGIVPGFGSVLSTDAKLKFLDLNGNSVWNQGETVVYDSGPTVNQYDLGEPVMVSNAPASGTPLRTVTHLFYKIFNGASWQPEQRLTTRPSNDATPSITQTVDGRIWIAWAGERQGGAKKQILVRTTTDGVTWTTESTITNVSTYGDDDPSIRQDHNGTIWIMFNRNVPCSSCGQAVFEADIYGNYSTTNGASWTAMSPLTSTTGQDEIQPSMVHLSDKNLYVFLSTLICSGTTCTVNIYYYKTMIPAHSAKFNSVTAKNATSINPVSIRVGQTLQLNASVTNNGDYNDTFVYWAKANSTLLPHTQKIVLSGQTTIITISWLTTGMKPGRYIITGNVTDSNGESVPNLGDNYATAFTITIRPAGDANGDCMVDVVDFSLVGASFARSIGQPGYNPIADLNGDGTVDIVDLTTVGRSMFQSC